LEGKVEEKISRSRRESKRGREGRRKFELQLLLEYSGRRRQRKWKKLKRKGRKGEKKVG
jgi:hypothetical protein